jgi:aryl-phospho-beta-D-glucosidase BglC (GH1 family)
LWYIKERGWSFIKGANLFLSLHNKSGFSFLTAALLFTSPAFADPNTIFGRLHTDGGQILNSQDRPVSLRGVNSSGMEWGAGQEWAGGRCEDKDHGCWSGMPDEEYGNLENWGFNTVRLPISWANLEPEAPIGDPRSASFHHYNEKYLAALDDIIRKFGRHHIAVVLSMHQWAWSPAIKVMHHEKQMHGLGMPVWLYAKEPDISQQEAVLAFAENRTDIVSGYTAQDGIIDAWKFIADRYKGVPAVVGADLFNEPSINFKRLKAFYEKAGMAVHAADPGLLLIFQDAVNQGYALNDKPKLPNTVYSFHMYPAGWLTPGKHQPSGKEEIEKHLTLARKWGVPIWIGEFGYIGQKEVTDGPGGWMSQTEAMLKFCREQNVHWCYWAYQKTNKPIAGASGKEPPDMDLVRTLQGGL